MKTIIFVMILAWPGGMLPPDETKMDSLEACYAEVERMTREMAKVDDTFKFVARCRVESQKTEPA